MIECAGSSSGLQPGAGVAARHAPTQHQQVFGTCRCLGTEKDPEDKLSVLSDLWDGLTDGKQAIDRGH